jgi:hypothetical protein
MGGLEWNRLAHREFRVGFRVGFHGIEAELVETKANRRKQRYGGQEGQKVGATPVLGALGRPEPTPLACGASGVAPTICLARRDTEDRHMKLISSARRILCHSLQRN